MIFEWSQIQPRHEESVGSRALLMGLLAQAQLPVTPGVCLSREFIQTLLTQHGLLERFKELISDPGNSRDTTSQQLRALFLDLSAKYTLSDAPIQMFLQAISKFNGARWEMAFSPSVDIPGGISNMRSSASLPPEQIVAQAVTFWGEIWKPQVLEWLQHRNADPFSVLGGMICQVIPDKIIRGSLTTCHPDRLSPFEMILKVSSADADDPEPERRGSEYLLLRDLLQRDVVVRRASHAHLARGSKSIRLTKEQIKAIGTLGARAWLGLKEHAHLTWGLVDDKAQILCADAFSKALGYFPYKEGQLQFSRDEIQQIERDIPNAQWRLESNLPFTPLGMSFDHLITRTINQGIVSCKLPLPLQMVRYVNGFRFRAQLLSHESGLLDRVKTHLRKRSLDDLEKEFRQIHQVKYLELLRVIEHQDLRKDSMREEQQIIEHTLRIIMRFVADTTELRGVLEMLEENERPGLDEQAPLRALSPVVAQLRRLQLDEKLTASRSWNEFVETLVRNPEGEKVIREIQGLQEGAVSWLTTELTDPAGEEDPQALFLFLKHAVQKPLNPAPPSGRANISDWEQLVFRGARTLHRIFINTGIKLKTMRLLNSERDIFFVTFDELLAIFSQPKPPMEYRRTLGQLVSDRRRAYLMWRELFPAGLLPLNRPHAPSTSGSRTLTGRGLVTGQSRGQARLVRSASDLVDVCGDEIVVAARFRPEWLPLLQKAAGLVIENIDDLGLLGPGLTRLGKPSVAHVADVFGTIRQRARLEVDGAAGSVRLL